MGIGRRARVLSSLKEVLGPSTAFERSRELGEGLGGPEPPERGARPEHLFRGVRARERLGLGFRFGFLECA